MTPHANLKGQSAMQVAPGGQQPQVACGDNCATRVAHRACRGQSAMEFLMTYGWAILVLIIVVAVLFYIGVLNPKNTQTNTLLFAPGLSAFTFRLGNVSGALELDLGQAQGKSIVITGISCSQEAAAPIRDLSSPILISTGEHRWVSGPNSNNEVLCRGEADQPLPPENTQLGERYKGRVCLRYQESDTGLNRTVCGDLNTKFETSGTGGGGGTPTATPGGTATPTPTETPTATPEPTATPTSTPSCSNGIQDGDETDVDCGGSCPPCANGKNCVQGSDCTSQICSGGRCQVPSCSDGVQNGEETDVDCGDGCSPCANGQNCIGDSDCLPDSSCIGGVCRGQDSDGDGIPDAQDNCPSVYNPSQADSDGDGVGDACDNCPSVSNHDQADGDHDGMGDACDTCTRNGVCTYPPETCTACSIDCGGQQADCGQGASCLNSVCCSPRPETCNGVDDDCNGVIDDGLGSTTCGIGACQQTVQNCIDGQTQHCVPGSPRPETCNGIDDDCNGVVDDNPGSLCGQGQTCQSGRCVPNPP